MSALTGSITFSKFFVRGEVPEDFRDSFMQSIQLRAFRPLTVEEEAEERAGWCNVEHPLDLELDHDKVFFNEYLNVGLRVDRWRIPSNIFKATFKDAERAYLAETGKEKLGRHDKDELRFTVTRQLRRQLMPTMKVIDLSWNVDQGVVRFWSQSASAVGVMVDLFEDTFPLQLVPQGVYTTAREHGLKQTLLDVLPQLTPSRFAPEVANHGPA